MPPNKNPMQERDLFWQVSHDMLGIADLQGVWLAVNPAWSGILGWDDSDIVGRTSEWLEHPDDRDKTRAEVAQLAAGRSTLNFENRYCTRGGDYRLLSWRAEPFEDRLFCVARDITQQREHELALKDSLDFARLALSAVSGVGVWTYDVATDRFFCDEAISDLYGIDPVAGLAGIPRTGFLANVHADDRAALVATMSGGLVRSGDLELEYRIDHPDGSIRWVLSRGHTYFDDNGKPVRRTGVGVDMSSQRRLEEQLRQSQKMEAVGQLTGGIAHDFNNLLQGITGPLELIRRLVTLNRTESLERYIDMAMSSAHRAAGLTQRLLAFSRRQPLDPNVVDVNHLVGALEDLLRRTMGESIGIELALDSEPCTTRCDANQLESALLNLSINARDAMPAGGTLRIATSREDVDEQYAATQRDVLPGRYVRIAVTDTGSGMPPDVVRQAFEPFFTTKPLGQGTGLGLSMVYGFAGQSGGFATLASQAGVGTTVSLYLPEKDGEQAPAADRVATQHLGLGDAHSNATILVVEDDASVRQLLVDLLTELKYKVFHAHDGPSGLRLLQSSTHFDLLISDVGLPGMNGRQIVDAVRAQRPDLRVLFMTGYTDLASSHGGLLDPGMQMITKPFSVEAIVNRVQGMLG
ncbi:PAS domain-containing sensor histidine kinase [Paraburkholderia sp. BCC1886]|uniref:hybrid sensor histidine kinase/response regulator n=1 Tax=Paraburkholderia sp. BCC1886 TaxID=2562670 RepID=UPI00164250FB|nr:PAS domain-containing protein [Paraburkholderia sp. BCC1886]